MRLRASIAAAVLGIAGFIADAGVGGIAEAAGAVTPTVVAVGDMACAATDPDYNGGNGTATSCRQRYVSDLVVQANPDALLVLGDNQYEKGELLNFQTVYGPTFGRANAVVYPSLGNAEYETPGAQGFFDYFAGAGVTSRIAAGNADTSNFDDGYYSFDLGAWHLIALNSNCGEVGGCHAGSRQEKWLKADLAAHPDRCTLAYWHHPRWNSGYLGNDSSSSAFWTDLYNAHADVVLNGHGNHHYERFMPQNPAGEPDPANGIREFIVSTGGEGHGSEPPSRDHATSEVADYTSFGILRLTLRPDGYSWQFIPEIGGDFTDSGNGTCQWVAADPPKAPSLSATSSPGSVRLSWAAPSDGGSPITGYRIYRGVAPGSGTLLKTVGNVTSYTDNSVANGTRYYYRVAAVNRVGEGPRSSEVAAAQPPATPSVLVTPGDRLLRLSWAAPADGGAPITAYKVYRGTSSGNTSLVATVGNVGSYDDGGLALGKKYFYRVAAVNSVGQGSSSAEVSATAVAVPAAPSLSVTVANGVVRLSWTAPADGGSPIAGYRIYRGTASGDSKLLAALGNVTSAEDTAVTSGVTYYYRVAALNNAGEGVSSLEASATLPLPAAPAAPPVLERFTPPVLTSLRLTPSAFRPARSGASIARAAGSAVTYTLTRPAVVNFEVERARRGVQRAGSCARRTARGRQGKPCTRLTRLAGTFSHSAAQGQNRFCFTGRLAGRRLPQGSYRLVAVVGAQLEQRRQVRARFRVVRRSARGTKRCVA